MATDHAALALQAMLDADALAERLDELHAVERPNNRLIRSMSGRMGRKINAAKVHGELAVAQAVRELHDLAAATAMGRAGL